MLILFYFSLDVKKVYTFYNVYIVRTIKGQKKYFKHVKPYQMRLFYIAFIYGNSQNTYFLQFILVLSYGE